MLHWQWGAKIIEKWPYEARKTGKEYRGRAQSDIGEAEPHLKDVHNASCRKEIELMRC
jgi:hypothetical protein